MPSSGPTQGAERHAAVVHRWTSHPHLARLLRVGIIAAPLVSSVAFTLAAGRFLPPDRLGLHRWLWVALVFVCSNLLLVIVSRSTKRLIPLVALMKLTLVFPDQAPSRTKAALRRSNSRTMLREMESARARGETVGAAAHGDYLVQLLRDLNDHDRLTRGHSERVRAFSELLGEEIGLNQDDLGKLRWAALLHDVGKLAVPSAILNKDGRPTDDEWKLLAGHPAAANPMLEPLRGWLGDWLHAADQHHCRWDGTGYPTKLAGTDISLAGRIVAIADAYDVMTSTRSYKQPLSPELARQELTSCAGTQFDPQLVRSFLQIGLGQLRTVTGPLAWIANLTGSAQLPVPATSAISTTAWTSGVAAMGVVAGAAGGVLNPPPDPAPIPEELAFVASVFVEDTEVTSTQGEPIEILLVASVEEGSLTFSVSGAAHGTVEQATTPASDIGNGQWTTSASYRSAPGYVGEDGFDFEACPVDGNCETGHVRLLVVAAPPTPTTTSPASTTTTKPTTTEAPTTTTTISPAPTTTAATTTTPTTTAPTTTAPTTTAPTTTTTTAAPTTTAPTTTAPTTTTTPPNAAPTANDDTATVAEDASVLIDVLDNDSDPESAPLSISGLAAPIHGTTAIDAGRVRYVPDPDFNGSDQFTYTVTDGTNTPVAATVSVTVSSVNDAPTAAVPGVAINEDAATGSAFLTVAANDVDGDTLTFSIIGGNAGGRFSVEPSGIVRLIAPLDYETASSYSLTYSVSDGTTSVVTTGSIAVVDINEAPLAGDDTATTNEDAITSIDLSVNDADPEGLALNWTVPGTSNAGASLSEVNGVVTYAPLPDASGPDSFTYTVADPAGNTSATATVTINVTEINDLPIAFDDSGVGYSTVEDTPITTADVTANDTDVDHPVDPASVSVVVLPLHGSATDNGDGTFTYSPDLNYVGDDTFQYTVTDGASGVSNAAVVTINMTNVNDAPVANNDAGVGYDTLEDTPLTTPDVTLNDSDLEDSTIDHANVTLVAPPSSGSVVYNGDGTFTYTPDLDSSGNDSFTYTIHDSGSLLSNQATVSLVVTAVNDAPRTTDDALAVALGNSATTIDVRLNDLDPEGDPLTIVSVSNGADGTVIDNGDGTLTYTHGGTPNPSDTFTYTVQDPQGAPTTATVAVTVQIPQDNDGVPAAFDNCPAVYNPIQIDTDGDGFGDECDANPSDPSSFFRTTTFQDLGTEESLDVAAGDIDGDGDIDVIFANNGAANSVWFGAGSTAGISLTNSGQSIDFAKSASVALADLDGDRDLDLVVANDDNDGNTIWFNNGAGIFTDSGQSLGTGKTQHASVGDFDSDGDIDLVFANKNSGADVWMNNGAGVFTDSGQSLGNDKGSGTAVADIDGDGDLDLVLTSDGDDDTILLNNGSGVFTPTGQTLAINRSHDVAFADFDADGDLDFVIAGDNDGDSVWLNNGAGTFTQTAQTLGLGHSRAVAVGDLDGDGDIDIAFGDHSGSDTLWENDGAGTFTVANTTIFSEKTEGIVLADIDGDGSLDVITAADGDANTVRINL